MEPLLQPNNPTTIVILIACAFWASMWAIKATAIAIYHAGIRRGTELTQAQGEKDPEGTYKTLLEASNKKRTEELEALIQKLSPQKPTKAKLTLFTFATPFKK